MAIRATYFLGFIIISTLLLTSLYFQMVQGIMPCPLCILQRITFGLLGILFLIGIFVYAKPRLKLIISILCSLTSSLGVLLAGRQVWLQHFPSADASECGVSLQYMMQALPMHQVIQKVFTGSAECTQRGWEFLTLNMAEWSLICFIGFLILSICLFVEGLRGKK
jgi:disulfide bond formation protein DsbB